MPSMSVRLDQKIVGCDYGPSSRLGALFCFRQSTLPLLTGSVLSAMFRKYSVRHFKISMRLTVKTRGIANTVKRLGL
jgi:hypothetical protein